MRRGLVYGFAAYFIWGFFPIYFKLLRPSGAVEVLAHRVLWSAVFVGVLLTVLRRWRAVAGLRRSGRTLAGIVLAAVLIGFNWGTYIYGINSDRIVETSLGYFITPLVAVLFGVLLLGERLRVAQWVAVGVGTVAVAILAIDYGRLPYIALILAGSFGSYALVKKRLGLPPADGLFLESAALAVPGIVFLALLGAHGEATVGSISAGHTVLILLAGVITAVPLMLFAGAANRISMTSIGMLQYVAPILQLSIGVFIYHEPMPPARMLGFAIVWVALAIFTWDGVRTVAKRRAAAAAVAYARAEAAPA